jgi:hypothetical protein
MQFLRVGFVVVVVAAVDDVVAAAEILVNVTLLKCKYDKKN